MCAQGEGQTALHIASAEGDEPLVKYFYGARASASIADHQGESPIDAPNLKLAQPGSVPFEME